MSDNLATDEMPSALHQNTTSAQASWLSVIIPARNEVARLPALLANLCRVLPGAEIIVVDGASTDATAEIAQIAGAKVIQSAANRGLQCNVGARHATADLLLFLHADCQLGQDATPKIRAYFAESQHQFAKLKVQFDGAQWRYRALEWLCQFDSFLTSYGDQGIVVRREFFLRQQLMPDIALFEDVACFRHARRLTRVRQLDVALQTSVRRFQQLGFFRTHWVNTLLIGMYLCGKSTDQLHARYYRVHL